MNLISTTSSFITTSIRSFIFSKSTGSPSRHSFGFGLPFRPPLTEKGILMVSGLSHSISTLKNS
ncbi:unnamed protein product [Brugia timori]|uniref:Uncharacterized protein n=1 Tax=Brugia timori TaxID=42155 RepID=A0A3P7W5E2_9BILA|nr:unnamed protein product [Brugia timori]